MTEYASSDPELDRLVQLLADPQKETWSKAELAHSMEMSPENVSAVLVRLQAEGLSLECSNRLVRLIAARDFPVAARVLPHLSNNGLDWRYHHYLRINSTNDAARCLAEAGAAEGTVVVAEEQTDGRGRLGRAWFSRKTQDVLLSLVLRPDMDPVMAPGLSLVVGLAASQAIRQVAGICTDLKWPNDVFTLGRKCCGVLTEMNADHGKIHFVIVGVGINVNGTSLSGSISGLASTLEQATGFTISRARLVAAFLNHLEALYLVFLDKGLGPLLERWVVSSSFVRGHEVVISKPGGLIRGITDGLSQQGALRIRTDDGMVEEVVAGDVVQW